MPSNVRVAHVSSAHPASDPRIHLREAASLSAAGYDVTVIAVHSDTELPETGVRVTELPVRPRLQRATIGSLMAVWAAIKSRAAIVHLHDPELSWAVVPLRLVGKAVIFDAHEDLPVQMLEKHYLRRGTRGLALLASWLVVKMAGRANHVIAATEAISRRFPERKVSVVRNYPRIRLNDAEAVPVLDRPRHVGYIGALSALRGALEMVDAFGATSFPENWDVVLAGSMSPDSLLTELVGRPGWARVNYKGVLSPDEARDLLNECRVGLVLFQRSRAHVDALPTKMFEYLAAGLPIIASDFPLWRSIIEPLDCGTLVDETSPDAIAAAVSRYASDPDLLARHGANALKAAHGELNWATQEPNLLSAYAGIVESRRSKGPRSLNRGNGKADKHDQT